VLGCYSSTGEITILQGWSWYDGSDPTQIGSSQYDFQTVVTHELGHALGLGGSADPNSPMNEVLASGVTRRTPGTADLNTHEPSAGADPERAAFLPIGSGDVETIGLSLADQPDQIGAEARTLEVPPDARLGSDPRIATGFVALAAQGPVGDALIASGSVIGPMEGSGRWSSRGAEEWLSSFNHLPVGGPNWDRGFPGIERIISRPGTISCQGADNIWIANQKGTGAREIKHWAASQEALAALFGLTDTPACPATTPKEAKAEAEWRGGTAHARQIADLLFAGLCATALTSGERGNKEAVEEAIDQLQHDAFGEKDGTSGLET
jgi:hypothetical protein